jgi:RNA polymerase sigma-70 factor (ECF subfamily)
VTPSALRAAQVGPPASTGHDDAEPGRARPHTAGAATADFTEFYLAHYRRLVGQLYLLTGDAHDAEEVLQEAFSRAYVRWERISTYDAPDAWVRRVAFNLASSRRRQAARAASAILRLGAPPAEPPAGDDSVVVLQALRTVSLRYRRALVLFYVADLPVSVIAEEMAIPEGTVKTWLRRGREQLRTVLGGDLEQQARTLSHRP